jgi:hypothetical protein
MAGLLFALLLMLAMACAAGAVVLRLLGVSDKAMPALADAGMVGLAAIGGMGLLLNFFTALGAWVVGAYTVILLTCAWPLRGQLASMLGNKPKAALATLAALGVAVAMGALRAPLHPDTGLYHFQTILWQHEAPLALGIANLDGKLGFDSLWHTIAAMFWLPGLGLSAVFAVNALIVILVLFGLIQHIAADDRKDSGFSRWYAVLCLFVLAISAFRGTGSPNTDYPSAVLNIYAFFLAARVCELWSFDRDNREQLHARLAILMAVVALALTIKLSQAMLALLPLVFLIAMLGGKLPRVPLVPMLAFGVGLGTLWMLRNIGLSGCAIYPLPAACIHDLPWAVGRQQVADLAMLVRTWGRSVVAPLASVQDNWDWVPAWLAYIYRYKLVWLPQVLCVAGIALLIARRAVVRDTIASAATQRMPWLQFSPLPVAAAAGLIFWFLSGPDIRFVYGNMISAPFLVLAWCLNQADIAPPHARRRAVGAIAIGLMLLHGAYLNRDTGLDELLQPWPQLTTPAGGESKTHAGATVFLAHSNGECWWQLPCAANVPAGLHMELNGLWTVFTIRPESAR